MRPQALFSGLSVPARPRPLAPTDERARTLSAGERFRLGTRGARLAQRLVLLAAVAALLLAAGLYTLRASYDARVYPAVHAAGIDLGGLTREEARAALQAVADDLERGTVTFSYQDRTWTPSLRELGAEFDVAGTLDRAYAIGREPGARARLGSSADLVRADVGVPLGLTFDHAVLGTWFDRVDGELGRPPHDAYLSVNGGAVSVVPELNGTIVDRGAATGRILDALRYLRPVVEPLPVVAKTAVVTADDLAVARDRLSAALAQPIRLSFGQASWTLSPDDLGAFVVQRIDPAKRGAEAHSVSLDRAKLARWLDKRIATSVYREPKNAVVGWNDGPVSIVPSEDGFRLRADDLAQQVEASLFGGHTPIVLPVDTIKPVVDSGNLGALGLTTLLGRGDSNYDGSKEGRRINVEAGAARLNGTLVPPGGEFSFNHAVGVINEENGFVEAQVIDGERIGRDIGGGICQVSTTVFRAALLAGLPISEWWPHKYRIPFYELDGWTPGLDASILQPEGDPFSGGDFRFLNPTDSWLLVEAWTTGVNVVVNIYGPDLGYDVQLSEPVFGKTIPVDSDIEVVDDELPPNTWQQSETAQEGIEVTYAREVYGRDGDLVRADEWYTLFWSRGNVYKVSPDMICKSPAGSCNGHEE